MSTYRLFTLTALFLCSILLGGCFFRGFHPTIQQGNIITNEKANSIRQGMSISRVEQILGTPVLKNIYPNDQLAYAYTLQVKGGKIHKRFLVIVFQNGRVKYKNFSEDWPRLPKP